MKLDTGEQVTAGLVEQVIGDELEAILEAVGADTFRAGQFGTARRIFTDVALADTYADFLTLPAYDAVLEAECAS